MQDYLREQPDNMRSIDLVTTVVLYLGELVAKFTASEAELVTQTIATLAEFAQGCEGNQEAIVQEQVGARKHDLHTLILFFSPGG